MAVMAIGSTLVDLAEDNHAWEAGFRIAGNRGVEDINACSMVRTGLIYRENGLGIHTHGALSIRRGGHIVVRFLDKHFFSIFFNKEQ